MYTYMRAKREYIDYWYKFKLSEFNRLRYSKVLFKIMQLQFST